MHEREPALISPITNPFTPGWAMGTDEHPAEIAAERDPVAVAASAPPVRTPEPAPDSFVRTEPPTLADLLPSVPPAPTASSNEHSLSALADLAEDDPEPDPDEDRRPRALPLLRRREPEKVDDAAGASEMIAWLDEVFAPKDPS
jgi:hypothetical protein